MIGSVEVGGGKCIDGVERRKEDTGSEDGGMMAMQNVPLCFDLSCIWPTKSRSGLLVLHEVRLIGL